MSSGSLPRLSLFSNKSAELMAGRSVIVSKALEEPALVTIQQSPEGVFCFVKLLSGHRFFSLSPGGLAAAGRSVVLAGELCYRRCLSQWAASRDVFKGVQVGKRYLLANSYQDTPVFIAGCAIASPRRRFKRYLLISPMPESTCPSPTSP